MAGSCSYTLEKSRIVLADTRKMVAEYHHLPWGYGNETWNGVIRIIKREGNELATAQWKVNFSK